LLSKKSAWHIPQSLAVAFDTDTLERHSTRYLSFAVLLKSFRRGVLRFFFFSGFWCFLVSLVLAVGARGSTHKTWNDRPDFTLTQRFFYTTCIFMTFDLLLTCAKGGRNREKYIRNYLYKGVYTLMINVHV
jgi:hypothetical protein